MAAHKHREATGHNTWTKEVPRSVARKTELAEQVPVTKPIMPLPKPRLDNPPPIPKGRLTKRAMCDGKVAHRSPAAAQLAVEKTRGNREFLNFYQCLYCGKYHVGHVIKPGK